MARFVRNLLWVVVLLAAAGMMFSLIADKAVAQIRAVLMKNVDEPGRMPYQHEVDTSAAECFPFICFIDFPAVPAGKRLVVQHVTAAVFVAAGGQPDFFAFGDSPVVTSHNIAVIQPVFTPETITGLTVWLLDRDVRVYYEPGTVPRLKIFASAPLNTAISNYTLHGYLIDATN